MNKTAGRSRKKESQKSTVVAFSLPQFMAEMASDRARATGHEVFSAYLRGLIKKDLLQMDHAA